VLFKFDMILCVDYFNKEAGDCTQSYLGYKPLTIPIIILNIFVLFLEGYLFSCIISSILSIFRTKKKTQKPLANF